jgi:nucleotide-binding universal stress UspA family protein
MTDGDVLYATDFSAASKAAGAVARDMARERAVRLHIVHVVPPVTDPQDSAERLERLAAEIGQHLPVERALLSGRVAHQIVRYARDKGIRLIVLGTHGRSGVSRMLLGSVAETVARLAPCPVLTVPVPAEATLSGEAAGEAFTGEHCIVCGLPDEHLVCPECRARIRREAGEPRKAGDPSRPSGRPGVNEKARAGHPPT